MSFGEGLGALIGGSMGADDLSRGMDAVNGASGGFGKEVAPYNTFGQSFLPSATTATSHISDVAGTSKGYDQFIKDYQTSPAARYQMDQATEAQNESAASKGGLLSGTNQRALSTINQGIAAQSANTAYGEYLQGNNQQFGQLESSLGNMFHAIGIGTTATGQEAGVTTGQMNNQSAIAQAQAKNDQGKGSGLGSLFGGLGTLATMF